MPNLRQTRGFTLIEVLVVIAVIGLLAGLLIPAVQMAREAARWSTCTNNLRQLGLAIHSYESATGVLPTGVGGYSSHAMLLPYLEQKPLYNAINFDMHAIFSSAANASVSQVTVGSFLCPSDPATVGSGGANSYAGNWGMGFDRRSVMGSNGPFTDRLPSVSLGDVTDGASATAAMAECLVGVPIGVRDTRRSVFQTRPIDEFEQFAATCHGLDPRTAALNGFIRGGSWLKGGLGETSYNHALPPNDHTCTNGSMIPHGAWTAGSGHSGGGANVLFIDSHVTFCKDTIARDVWRAIGTMNGGEVIDAPSE